MNSGVDSTAVNLNYSELHIFTNDKTK